MEKFKGRFTSLDVRAVMLELFQNGIVGSHLQNIYDINSRTFLFKFTKRDLKMLLLLESGVRIHFTRLDRENPHTMPSTFAAKLRKHLRERRLTKIEQLGFDRIVHLEFGHDTHPEMTFHLYLEFFAMGNIILTDVNHKVISLIREVKVKDKETNMEIKKLASGMIYDSQVYQSLNISTDEMTNELLMSNENAKNAMKICFPVFTPIMIEHCLSIAETDPKSTIPPSKVPKLLAATANLTRRLNLEEVSFKGVVKSKDGVLIDFNPMLLDQTGTDVIVYDSFNEAVDEYFYKLEERQNIVRSKHQEMNINKKFEAIKNEQGSRIKVLEENIRLCLLKAHTIEANVRQVEDAILVINTGLRNELSWRDLEALVESEKQKGRPTALLMEKLRLNLFLIDLRLPLEREDIILDVDIRLDGHSNANRYYEMRKMAIEKLDRTKTAFEQAMKSAEAKIRADFKKEWCRTQHLIPKRKSFWFEKFNWFISSDSYLIISGRDMHQNEYLVKRLLRNGDAYVHADLAGASSVIVKNHRKQDDEGSSVPGIPYRTLLEAGAFSLCFSKAWEAKIVTSAWWVHASQVSKTAPSGEYLGTGSFMVRGKKNFLPPAQLILSFGFMFILDDESATKRKAARLEKEAQRLVIGEMADIASLDDRETKYMDLLSESNPPSISGPVEELVMLRIDDTRSGRLSKLEKSPLKQPEQILRKKGSVRGKHGKEKKLKQKYRDQDEEEREMRMQLLGSRSKQQMKVSPKINESRKVELKGKQVTHPRQAIQFGEEGLEEEAGTNELAIIDYLTGTPSSTDVVTGILAVSAPFIVMQHYKYRVKLLPGQLKRGTAVKTAISLILSENRQTITQHERNLIKSVPDTELNATMPNKTRIAGSGIELSKIKKSLKNKK